MKRLAIILALIGSLALPGAAAAQSGYGTFTDRNGVQCSYSVMGTNATVHCSGYTRSGVYMSYSYSCWYWSGMGWQCS